MRREIILLLFGLLLLFSFVQLHFLSYYNVVGIPFGKSDVDNYMMTVREGDIRADHVLITAIPYLFSSVLDSGLFYTVFVPFFACIILPITLFMFSYYFSKRWEIALFSVVFMLFGTFTLQVYLISALWAQMMSTVFALWSIIFIDRYANVGGGGVLKLAAFSLILTILSHPAGFGMVAIYVALILYERVCFKKTIIAVSSVGFIIGMWVLCRFTNLLGNYIYKVNVFDVFTGFAPLFVWFYAIFLMFIDGGVIIKRLFKLVIFIFLISSFFVLWRPMLSVLPVVSYMAGCFMFKVLVVDTFIRRTLLLKIILVFITIFGLVIFTSMVTNDFMLSMLWEMEVNEGVIDGLPRSINSTIIRDIYFGGKHICVVTNGIERCR